MAFKEPQIQKVYYSIGEIAEMFSVNTSLVRFWEKEFEIIQPKKNRKGNRLFTQKDLANFKMIYHLVKERGFTLDGARKKLKENPDELDHQMEVVSRLQEIRSFLLELKEHL